MIDDHGYRPNVGIVLCNHADQVFWARRSRNNGWQFPQGGIQAQEDAEQAMFRELYEEVGLLPAHVAVLGRTREWLYYDLPPEYRRSGTGTVFKGQKQIWYLLRLLGADADVCLSTDGKPEFDAWRWIDYWSAVEHIIVFKREVYHRALRELEPLLRASKGSE